MQPTVYKDTLPEGYELHWYEFISVLGRGAYGITYLARDKNLDCDVAIKEYLPSEFAVRQSDGSVKAISEDKNELYKWGLGGFIGEARTLAKFSHPNIIRVSSVFEHNNTAYMVMEYEQGDDLSIALKKRERLKQQEILDIFIPILEGLGLVHKAGFIHRDIKPSNIYIRHDDSPVLLDFGSARQTLGSRTKTLTSLVSVGYAPLEQYTEGAGDQGQWTDIYALGASMYYCIIGDTPEDAVTRSASIVKDGVDSYEPLSRAAENFYDDNFLKAIDFALSFRGEDRDISTVEWAKMLKGEVLVEDVLRKLGKPIDPPLKSDSGKIGKARESVGESEYTPTLRIERDQVSAKIQKLKAAHGKASTSAKPVDTKRRVTDKIEKVPETAVAGSDVKPIPLNPRSALQDKSSSRDSKSPVASADHNVEKKIKSVKNPEDAASDNHKQSSDSNTGQVISAKDDEALSLSLVEDNQPEHAPIAKEDNNTKGVESNRLDFEPADLNSVEPTEIIGKQESPSTHGQLVRDIADVMPDNVKDAFSHQAGKWKKKVPLNLVATGLIVSIALGSLLFGNSDDVGNSNASSVPTSKQMNAQVVALLEKASASESSGHLAEPYKDSALQYYRQALDLDAANADAHAGIEKIEAHYAQMVKQLIDEREYGKIEGTIRVIESITQNDELSAKLRKEFIQAKQMDDEIDRLLTRANAQLDNNQVLAPENDNAVQTYRDILSMDADNQAAKRGLQGIVAFYANNIDIHIEEGDIQAAKDDLDKLKLSDPESPSVAIYEGKLNGIQPKNEAQSEMAKLAEKHIREGRLITPVGNNALKVYQDMLKKSPKDAEALSGIERIKDHYKKVFDIHLSQLKFNKAKSIANKVASFAPNSDLYKQMQSQIKSKQALIRSETNAISQLVGEFKQAIESLDVNKVTRISESDADRQKKIKRFLENSQSLAVHIGGFKYIAKDHKAVASVYLSKVINNEGDEIEAGSLSQFDIVVSQNKNEQWRVYW